jgi:hypothetical protein
MIYDLFLIIPLLMVTAALLVGFYGPVESASERAVPAWQQWILSFAALVAFFRHFLASAGSNPRYAGMANKARSAS